MTKSTGNDRLATSPTPGLRLGAILGFAMLVAAATQVAAVPVAHADSGPVFLHAADLSVEPGESGDPLHSADECVTVACHGFSLVAAPETGVLTQAGAPATLDRDRSVAGIVVLPPLHPPNNSLRV